jgi:hypothetical protein
MPYERRHSGFGMLTCHDRSSHRLMNRVYRESLIIQPSIKEEVVLSAPNSSIITAYLTRLCNVNQPALSKHATLPPSQSPSRAPFPDLDPRLRQSDNHRQRPQPPLPTRPPNTFTSPNLLPLRPLPRYNLPAHPPRDRPRHRPLAPRIPLPVQKA